MFICLLIQQGAFLFIATAVIYFGYSVAMILLIQIIFYLLLFSFFFWNIIVVV